MSSLGYLIEGGIAYAKAWAAGDCASSEEEARRACVCAACPSLTLNRSPKYSIAGMLLPGLANACYCGSPLKDHMASDPPTCGCPVLAASGESGVVHCTVNGVQMAATGASRVGSKRCPQDRW